MLRLNHHLPLVKLCQGCCRRCWCGFAKVFWSCGDWIDTIAHREDSVGDLGGEIQQETRLGICKSIPTFENEFFFKAGCENAGRVASCITTDFLLRAETSDTIMSPSLAIDAGKQHFCATKGLTLGAAASYAIMSPSSQTSTRSVVQLWICKSISGPAW